MKHNRILFLFQIAILLSLLCACSNEAAKSNIEDGFDYEYSNAKGQSFAFHCSNPNATVYEKTVNDLISEWNDNVALAEKTYNRNDVLILTEGYVQNINKESKDSYYMLLSQDEDSGLFSTEELRVYFNDETLDSLMKLKKGDYVTLLCTAQTGYNLSSRNLIWDAGRVGLVVSHNGVNDGDHLPAGVAHGRHVGLPFISFFLKIKL